MKAYQLSFIFATIFHNFASGTPTTTSNYKFTWVPRTGYSCQSQSGKGESLTIGQDGNHFDSGITVKFCKDKCAKNDLCQGFDFQDIIGQAPICRYKGNIDGDTLTPEKETDCYIYTRPSVVPPTPPPSRCDDKSSCMFNSCDYHISLNPVLTCAKLEKDVHCNCRNCNCRSVTTTTRRTPVSTTTPGGSFPFPWTVKNGYDCVSSLFSVLHIGEEVDGRGRHKAFDKWPAAKCQAKCASNRKCKGFNYANDLGVCRYKQSLSHAKAIRKPTNDCWIYDRDGTTPAIKAGTTAVFTTTTTAFEFRWLQERSSDCAALHSSQNLAIGDNVSPRGGQQTFDVGTVDKCKRKCAKYKKCDGFNYEQETSMCRYKSGITTDRLIPERTHDCYAYMRPKADRSTDTCVYKTCMGGKSCDWHTFRTQKLTCEALEQFKCDCKGCQCLQSRTTGSRTTPRPRTRSPVTYTYKWQKYAGKQCAGSLALYPRGSNLPIGRDNLAFDKNVSPEDCKRVCARDERCLGFNFDSSMNSGTCRYKASGVQIAELTSRDDQSCYVYMRGGTSVSFGTFSTSTSTAVTRATINWMKMKGVDCVSTPFSLLRIGEEVDDEGKHKAFDTWSVGKCQAKCVNNPACKGFNYDNDQGVCRYKKSLSHAKTIQTSTHDCWIYESDGSTITIGKGTIATRPPTTTFTTTTYAWLVNNQKDCSSAQSRDLHIGDIFVRNVRQNFDVATIDQCQRKCAQYINCDGFNYDSDNGICHYQADISYSSWSSSSTFNCYVYLRPTTTTSTTPLTRPVRPTGTTTRQAVAPGWKFMKNVDCVSGMMSLLRIGEEVDDEGRHKAFDTWSVGKCQAKCAKNAACKGFNYDNDMGVCRYKKSLSHAKTIQRSTHDCWVYDPAGIPITIGKGTIATRPPTTPSTTTSFEYGWLLKLEKDCSSLQSRDLHIGDKFVLDSKQSFDVATIDQCQRKCAQYLYCDGFNYDSLNGICHYQADISYSIWRSSSIFDCYIYLRPTTSTTTTTTTITTAPTQPTTTPTPQATQTPTKASIVTAAPSPPPNRFTPKSIANRPSQRPTTTSTLRPKIDSVQGNTTPKSGGTIAGAVVGTILGVAALAGAIVAVMLFLKGRKHADVDNVITHNTGNLTVGITDAEL